MHYRSAVFAQQLETGGTFVLTMAFGEGFSLLYEYWEMLLEAGMGGYSDGGEGIIETDLNDLNAVELSRIKRR